MRILTLFALTAAFALAADKPEKGFKPIFNGKDLTNWTKAKENEEAFKVENGEIVAHGKRCHLFYTGKKADFKNFELRVDVMTEPKANGGIYFHTAYQETGWPSKGFEVQVNNSHTDWRRTGGLYAVADNKEKVAEDGKWFTEHIVVKDNHVTIYVDGKKTSEWDQPADWKAPRDMPGRSIGSGTFALQAHDPGSVIRYKNIRVKQTK
ncbi:MAG: DUF1080 domain-containing protein [Acidobacteria bacterium]|nr:DUF1080 domain-containing protein [Acidobacteriota bacterium]